MMHKSQRQWKTNGIFKMIAARKAAGIQSHMPLQSSSRTSMVTPDPQLVFLETQRPWGCKAQHQNCAWMMDAVDEAARTTKDKWARLKAVIAESRETCAKDQQFERNM